jgi:catechol 2,3-dioxygenase-like lactoylglutathione lyase family enzyme
MKTTAALLSSKCFALLVALALPGCLLAQSQPADSATADDEVRLQRATITVANADASIAFYRDMLGFKVSSDNAYDSPALRQMFNIPAGSTPRLVLLDGSAGQARALGLVAADGLEIDREANRVNAPALVLTVNRLDEIHARLQAAQVEVVQAPSVLLGFDGKAIGREAMYLDPDGVRIVLFELSVN